MADNTKRRYIKISGNGLPFCICSPGAVFTMLAEFLGVDGDPIGDPIVIEDCWMTDAEFDDLPEWEG